MFKNANWSGRLASAAIGAGLLAASTLSADVVALKAGTLHTGTGDPIENGIVIIEDGTIIAVGPGIPIPGDATVFELEEGHITAGRDRKSVV